MAPFPLPVDVYIHYCTMINQISQGRYPDPFGMERVRINHELRAIIENLDGKTSGIHMIIRITTGELIISGSAQDLEMLSKSLPYDMIQYYGLVDQGVVGMLKGISYG